MVVLGELEQAVMDILWQRREALTVRDVHDLLSASRDLAYTTVMTVLDRLAKKGIVRRELNGRAWQYLPAVTRADLVANEIVALLSSGTPSSSGTCGLPCSTGWTLPPRRPPDPSRNVRPFGLA
ncbi:MAG: BlaI/MecI/CopY family transcriptional regulator [Micropruina sp.]|nr:MAG: BlaI/MecI/CopY family transcriptional regulator [Micropruina sp.]